MEEAKSFSLQSPERIAKLYGGNKQKILQALQSGALRQFAPAPMDQLLATAAANFIDEVRDAAQAEAVPQQTVFDKLFTPPQPQMPQGMPQAPMGAPAGLGATPEAAAMPAPAAAPPMGMPREQAVPGMAMGGMVPPYASGGGLSDLPLPDGMFDEPSNGGFNDGYRGGGLVAFAEGEEVTDPNAPPENVDTNEIVAVGDTSPESINGFYRDPKFNLRTLDQLAPQQHKYSDKLNAFYEDVLNPEKQKARRKEDMWMALGQIGAKMASTPGSLLQAASAGIGEALPGVLAAAKERRAEQRDAIKTLAQQEGLSNKDAREVANIAVNMSGKYGDYREADLNRKQQKFLKMFEEQQANYRAQVGASAQRYSADRSAAAQMAFADKQIIQLERQVAAGAVAQLPELRAALNNPIGLANNAYKMALQKFGGNSQQAAAAYATLQNAEDAYVQAAVQRARGGMSGGSGYGAPPKGAVQRVN